jgi:3-deoxy-D-manno-octulosonate 8-phosphate phosphatase (KDO 8-P phosphatase)
MTRLRSRTKRTEASRRASSRQAAVRHDRSAAPSGAARPRAVSNRRAARRPSTALLQRLRDVRLLLCDVDGVLTNATVLIGDGREFKQFHIQDGLAMRLLHQEGFKVGWISARPSTATRQRAEELDIDFLHQERGSKVEAIEGILRQAGLAWKQVCYVGDDVVDLGALRRAGAAVAVANAIPEVQTAAHYVTQTSGGHGAIREVATLLLKAHGRWERLIADFSK